MEVRIVKTPHGREVVERYEDEDGVPTNRPIINRVYEREIDALAAVQRLCDGLKKRKLDELVEFEKDNE